MIREKQELEDLHETLDLLKEVSRKMEVMEMDKDRENLKIVYPLIYLKLSKYQYLWTLKRDLRKKFRTNT